MFGGHLSTLGHGCCLGQGCGGGQLFLGSGHFLHIPALTLTFGHTQDGHFCTGGIVDFNTSRAKLKAER